jgi:hypothetical protein
MRDPEAMRARAVKSAGSVDSGARWLRRLSTVVYGVTLGLAAAAVYWAARGGSALPAPGWGFHGDEAVLGIAFSTAGAMITANRPRNKIGWLLMAVALGSATSSLVDEYHAVQRVEGRVLSSAAPYLLWLTNWLWVTLAIPAWIFVPSIFPTGKLVSARWRWVPVLGIVAMAALFLVSGFASPLVGEGTSLPNPLWVEPLAPLEGPLFGLGIAAMIGGALGAAASLVVRYRRASTEERLQLKWIMYATVLLGLTVPLAALPYTLLNSLVALTTALLSVAIGVAVLRYRLYDIDVIINRTLVYGPLTAIVAGLIAASSRLFSIVITPIAGEDSDLTTVLTTLMAVAAVTPLRNRLQSFVDAHFKEIHDPSEGLEDLRGQMSTGIWVLDRDRSLSRLLAAAIDAFQARGGAVYRKGKSKLHEIERRGNSFGEPGMQAVLEGAQGPIGELRLGPRADGRPYSSKDQELLQEIAGEVGRALAVAKEARRKA